MNLINKIINCPVCKQETKYYKQLKEVTLYYCKNCKHRFTDPNSIHIKENYSLEYFKEKHPNWFENQNINLFNYIFQVINSNEINSPSVLDVCCGQGDLLKYLKQKTNNFKLTGIDFHKNDPEKNINFLSGDIFETKFNEKFDVIINLASIEHIWNVEDYMKLLSSLCKDGGLIITMTINDSSLVYGVARFVYSLGMKLPMERLYDKHHLNHFSKNSLEFLHTENSLDIIEKPYTEWPMESVDLPKSNILLKLIYKSALFILFFSEKLTGKTILQTITARKKSN